MALKAIKATYARLTSRRRARTEGAERAIIRRTEYGATIEFSDGRKTSLWTFALDEPVLEVALRRARNDGAKLVLIELDSMSWYQYRAGSS